jgi:hypothetical protein
MIYGCDECEQGFKMYLEVGLEEVNDGERRKPVPFAIKCPFCASLTCAGLSCHDIAFQRFQLKKPMSPKGLPFFANVKGDDCGKPMHMECAKPEYRRFHGGAK